MDLGVDMEPTEDDKAKIYQRINRFGKQGAQEGNKKKKISIDDMLKTVVSDAGWCWVGTVFVTPLHGENCQLLCVWL